MTRVATLVLVAAALAPAPSEAAPGVDGLLERFAAVPGLSAQFVEKKHIGLLAMPLVTEGAVHYLAPGRLARHATKPAPSSLLLDGDTVRMGDAHGQQALDLSGNPALGAFVRSFVHLLRGDRTALERGFVVAFEPGQGDAWTVRLTPRDAAIAKMIAGMEVTGTGVVVARLVIRETNGDTSETTFTGVDPAWRPDAAEAARVFRIPPG